MSATRGSCRRRRAGSSTRPWWTLGTASRGRMIRSPLSTWAWMTRGARATCGCTAWARRARPTSCCWSSRTRASRWGSRPRASRGTSSFIRRRRRRAARGCGCPPTRRCARCRSCRCAPARWCRRIRRGTACSSCIRGSRRRARSRRRCCPKGGRPRPWRASAFLLPPRIVARRWRIARRVLPCRRTSPRPSPRSSRGSRCAAPAPASASPTSRPTRTTSPSRSVRARSRRSTCGIAANRRPRGGAWRSTPRCARSRPFRPRGPIRCAWSSSRKPCPRRSPRCPCRPRPRPRPPRTQAKTRP